MDLDTLDTRKGAEAGFDVHLKHPKTNAPIGAVIRVVGADAEAYQQKTLEQQRDRMQQVARQGRILVEPEQQEEQGLALLAAATLSWSGITVRGVTLEFSQSAAAKLYREFPWIREQVDEAIHTRANFLPRSAGS